MNLSTFVPTLFIPKYFSFPTHFGTLLPLKREQEFPRIPSSFLRFARQNPPRKPRNLPFFHTPWNPPLGDGPPPGRFLFWLSHPFPRFFFSPPHPSRLIGSNPRSAISFFGPLPLMLLDIGSEHCPQCFLVSHPVFPTLFQSCISSKRCSFSISPSSALSGLPQGF